MEKALNYTSVDRGSQTHSATRGNQGKQGAVFHGQGGEPESHKEDVAQYFRLVDQSLRPTLNTRNLPLLLAGVEYLLPIYREVNSYPHLAEVELRGNFEHEPAAKLLEKAWSVMGPSFEAKREQVAARYRQLAGTGKTSDNIENILPAAYDGRVDALFVDQATHQWGIYATASRFIEVHEEFQAGDDDLLDIAAVQTLLHNGSVYAVERDAIPENKATVALLRY